MTARVIRRRSCPCAGCVMVSLRRKATRCEMIAPCIGNRKSLNEFNKNRIELPQRRVSRGAIPGFGRRRDLRLLHTARMRSREPQGKGGQSFDRGNGYRGIKKGTAMISNQSV